MYFVGPIDGEWLYRRMLVTTVRGSQSFEDLRAIPKWSDLSGLQISMYRAGIVGFR
jgi:hypothetical protein